MQDTCATGALPTDPTLTTEAVEQQQPDGSWQLISTNCAAHNTAAAAPQVTPVMARQQAERLVPHPAIGAAPATQTLVNIQTVLWADTTADRTLGAVSVLGHRVDLAVTVAHIDWAFGDGHTDTTTAPGRAYDANDPCRTAQCPSYWGHTYTSTGHATITATIIWTGRYRVDNGAWQPIAGTVTGSAAPTTLTIRQAHAVLVRDPKTSNAHSS